MQNLTLISPPTSCKAHGHLLLRLTETTLKRMAQMCTAPTGKDEVATCLDRGSCFLGEARYAHMKRHTKDRDGCHSKHFIITMAWHQPICKDIDQSTTQSSEDP